jgi:peptide/nickel transport system substrate-binding protein
VSATKQKFLASFLQKRSAFFLVFLVLSAPALAQKSTLSIGLVLEPPVLDPTINPADPIRQITNGNVFEGLTWIDEAGHVVPRLATSWTISPDGLRYRFQLRDHVRFQDGTPFDCAIVRYAYGRAAAAGSINPQKQFFTPILSVDCPSRLEAVLTLARPIGNLPYELAWPDAAMVAPATEAGNGTHPVGTGPYAFAAWKRGDSVTLVRNDQYWGAKPAIATVTFRFIPDPLAEANALLSGALDAFPTFAGQDLLGRLAQDKNLVVVKGSFPIKIILALNEARKPFSDIRVRRALAMAVDRPSLAQGAGYPGAAVIGSHMSPSDPDYTDLSGRYAYDPEKAKALLAAAGVPPGFKLTITLPPIDYAHKIGELLAAYFGEIGLNVTLAPVAWPQWLSQVFTQHDYQATVIGHVEPNDLDIYARPNYYFGYHDADYAKLFDQFTVAEESGLRHRLSLALQRKLADDEPNVFLFSAPRTSVWNAKLRGMWVNEPISATPLDGVSWSP